jgi:signal transduction histidine kinase
VADEVHRTARADAVGIALVDPGEASVEFLAHAGHADGAAALPRRVFLDEAEPLADAVRGREPVWLESLDDWEARYPHLLATARERGQPAAAAVPLIVCGRVLGCLTLGFRRPQRFEPAQQAFLVTLGPICALALERARLEDRQARERQVFDALFSALPVGVALLDHEARYVRINPFLADMNGAPVEQHLGRTPSQVLGEAGGPLEELARSVMATGEPVGDLEIRTPAPRGGTVTLRASFFPVELAEGTGVGAVVADETGPKRSEAALQHANEELKRSSEQRARFMHAVAHELKNPLTALVVQVQLLDYARSEEQRRTAMGSLKRNLERIRTLAEDLSQMAYGGQMTLQKERASLAWMLGEAVRRNGSTAEHAGVELRLVRGKDAVVLADPARIAQVLDNLLSNALKFTPSGGEIEVSTQLRADAAVVRVRDTGLGLTGQQRERLFQPFARLHPEARRTGTGLGLYISKAIVEAHDGRIWAESPGPGQGSTFSFSLPTVSKPPAQA